MKEIGGYFGLEKSHGNSEYYSNLIALNTARNALVYICKARNIKKIYIPYFLCDTTSKVCERENIEYEYYHIDKNFRPIFEKEMQHFEYFYFVNYYGQFSNEEILYYKKKYKNIIVDNVQAFFQEPIDGIDTIYSCRKFVGVPDGAYLSTDCYISQKLEIDDSSSRTKHIYGRPLDGASAHYKEFQKSEVSLYELDLKLMSPQTHELLNDIDYYEVKTKREKNFLFLENEFRMINKLNVIMPTGPYAYPLYIENGNLIRKQLVKNNIYVATLWPNVKEGYESKMANNILPIPCDQRYNIEDMKFVVEEIEKCQKQIKKIKF